MDIPAVVTANPGHVKALPPRVRKHLRQQIKPRLQADPFDGDQIRRSLWPKNFKRLPNLCRFELPSAHRGVYIVLTHPGRQRGIRILWLGDHKKYDRLFGYATS